MTLMATDNKAVTTYIPKEVEKSLTQYCLNNGLTRNDRYGNDKPSLGTAIVEVLKDYFSITGDRKSKSQFSQQVRKEVMEEVKDLVNDLQEKILSVKENFEEFKNNAKVNYSSKSFDIGKEQLEISIPKSPFSLSRIDNPSDFRVLQKHIARRLGVSAGVILSHQKKGIDYFSEWSNSVEKEINQVDIAWTFIKKEKGQGYFYHPIDATSNEILASVVKWARNNDIPIQN